MDELKKAHEETDVKLEQMQRKIHGIYSRARTEVEVKWHEYMNEIAPKIDRLQMEYDEAKASGDKKEIRKAGIKLQKAKIQKTTMNNHYKALVDQIAENISHVNEIAIAYINGEMPEIYSLNYNAVAKSMTGELKGYSFELMDEHTVKRMITKNEIYLPLKQIEKTKDIQWNIEKINGEVLQGILQGDSIPKIAKRIQNVEGMNENAAVRTARTIATSAENLGRMDMLRDAIDSGIEVQKEWLATLDKRTRHEHRQLNGQVRDVEKPFDVDGYTIMEPGDPEAEPKLVYNCRCTLTYNILGFKKVRSD